MALLWAQSQSVFDMLGQLESQLGQPVQRQATLLSRLEALETQVLGKPQTGPIGSRAQQLYAQVLGQPQVSRGPEAPQTSIKPLIQGDALAFQPNYLEAVLEATSGHVIRWQHFPLRIWVEESLAKEPQTQAMIQRICARWSQAVPVGQQSLITFIPVKNRTLADIQVKKQLAAAVSKDPLAVAVKGHDAQLNKSQQFAVSQVLQVASMLAPGPFALLPQLVSASLSWQQQRWLEALREESTLYIEPTELQEAHAMQAMGRILGLKHPQNCCAPNAQNILEPTLQDRNTLLALYARPATLVLNTH